MPNARGLLNPLSYSGDAILATTYLDDNIVAGNVYSITISQSMTEETAIYFTSEYTTPTINAAFLLPICIHPVSGYAVLNIYEDTGYTGGDAITPTNRNRTSGNTAEVTVKLGAAGESKGTLILTCVFGTEGSGLPIGGHGGGDGGSANSLIMNLGKRYLYELTNSETAVVGINAEFAEI